MNRTLAILLTWLGAAVLVAATHTWLDGRSVASSAALVIGSITLMAFVYMRVCMRNADASHALGVGIAWLALSIVAEIVLTRMQGHGWYSLLGSPMHPVLRNLFPFAWIFIPVLFARSSDAEAPAR